MCAVVGVTRSTSDCEISHTHILNNKLSQYILGLSSYI
jgi:hypothetical protein